MSEKKIVQYSAAYFGAYENPVSHSVSVQTVDHPGPFYFGEQNGDMLTTSAVVSYDETTGIFETQNTVYVPVGSLTE